MRDAPHWVVRPLSSARKFNICGHKSHTDCAAGFNLFTDNCLGRTARGRRGCGALSGRVATLWSKPCTTQSALALLTRQFSGKGFQPPQPARRAGCAVNFLGTRQINFRGRSGTQNHAPLADLPFGWLMPNSSRMGRDSHGPVSGMGGQTVSLSPPKIITSA